MTKRKLIVQEEGKSLVAEAYRTLRTNIQFSKNHSELQVIMFTSAGPVEGKSSTAANTAVALAQSGKQVIIMDCDLRRPVQHKVFNTPMNFGVTNILVEKGCIGDFLQNTEIDNLRVLTSGPIPPNPSELLGSLKMRQIIEQLRAQAEYLIIDVPPVVAVTDASVLASKVDGIVLVVNAGKNKPEMVRKAKELLLKAKGDILGVVLNCIEIEEEYSCYYNYYDGEQSS